MTTRYDARFNEWFNIDWHWPKVYRYKVAFPRRFKPGLNRYPGSIIGVYAVVGRYAYCIKWGWARAVRKKKQDS